MGVLDDAIREHLELKRRHGAPEEELRRQEEEALGPARREVARPDEDLLGDGEPAVEGPEPAAEASPEPAGGPESTPFDVDALPPLAAPDEPEPFPEEAAPAVSHPVEPAAPLPEAEEQEGADEAARERLESHPPPMREHPSRWRTIDPAERSPEGRTIDPAEHSPEGWTIDRDPADPPEGRAVDEDPAEGWMHGVVPHRGVSEVDEHGAESKSPDVPEDTPDFLEETPEHERLWLEQKPRRDFDFD